MTRQEQITMLDQVQHITTANNNLLAIARVNQGKGGEEILEAVKKLLEACDIINQLGSVLQPTETANPKLN